MFLNLITVNEPTHRCHILKNWSSGLSLFVCFFFVSHDDGKAFHQPSWLSHNPKRGGKGNAGEMNSQNTC